MLPTADKVPCPAIHSGVQPSVTYAGTATFFPTPAIAAAGVEPGVPDQTLPMVGHSAVIHGGKRPISSTAASVWDSFRFSQETLSLTTESHERLPPSVVAAMTKLRAVISGYHDTVPARTFLAIGERDLTISENRIGRSAVFSPTLVEPTTAVARGVKGHWNARGSNHGRRSAVSAAAEKLTGFWAPAPATANASGAAHPAGFHSSDGISTAPSSLASSMVEGYTPRNSSKLVDFASVRDSDSADCDYPAVSAAESPICHFERLNIPNVALTPAQQHPARQSVVNWMMAVFQAMGWPSSCFFIAIHSFDTCLAQRRHTRRNGRGAGSLSIPLLTTGCTLAGVAAECDHRQLQKARCLVGQVPSVGSVQDMLCAEVQVVASMKAGTLVRQTPLDFVLIYLAAAEIACPAIYRQLDQLLVRFPYLSYSRVQTEKKQPPVWNSQQHDGVAHPSEASPNTELFIEHILDLAESKPPITAPLQSGSNGSSWLSLNASLPRPARSLQHHDSASPSSSTHRPTRYVTIPFLALLVKCCLSFSVSYFVTGLYTVYPSSAIMAGLMVLLMRGVGIEPQIGTLQVVFGQQVIQRIPAIIEVIPGIIRRCLADPHATSCWSPFVRTILLAIVEHPQRLAAARLAFAISKRSFTGDAGATAIANVRLSPLGSRDSPCDVSSGATGLALFQTARVPEVLSRRSLDIAQAPYNHRR